MAYKGIVAGLGNPGQEYAHTRHNCGFDFIDRLLAKAREEGEARELSGKKFNALLWQVELPELNGVWLAAKPLTFMNDSGKSLQPLLAWHNLRPKNLVVAQDELDIPPGELRFKEGGGLAGHNGLLSISQHLGSRDFCRIRIGIGKPEDKSQILRWVLGKPSPHDAAKIAAIMPYALETLFIFSNEGAHEASLFARHAEV